MSFNYLETSKVRSGTNSFIFAEGDPLTCSVETQKISPSSVLWIQNDFFRIRSGLWTPSGFSPDPMPTSFQFLPNSVRIQCRLLFNTFRILFGSNKKNDQLKTSQIRIDNTKTSTWSWRYCRWWILCGELGGAGDMAASSTGGIIHPLATLLRSPYKTIWKLKANSCIGGTQTDGEYK